MSKIIIGVDPDSKAHGVAIYHKGKLTELGSMDLVGFCASLDDHLYCDIEIHIEDVNAISAAFTARDSRKPMNVKLKMAQSIGMCKQAQVELERMAEHRGIKIVKHKISKMWKKDKAQFEKVTGWTGRSNEDTRSAAYFGFLGI